MDDLSKDREARRARAKQNPAETLGDKHPPYSAFLAPRLNADNPAAFAVLTLGPCDRIGNGTVQYVDTEEDGHQLVAKANYQVPWALLSPCRRRTRV